MNHIIDWKRSTFNMAEDEWRPKDNNKDYLNMKLIRSCVWKAKVRLSLDLHSMKVK